MLTIKFLSPGQWNSQVGRRVMVGRRKTQGQVRLIRDLPTKGACLEDDDSILVAVDNTMEALLEKEDTDGDGLITVDDNGPKICDWYQSQIYFTDKGLRLLPLATMASMAANALKSAVYIAWPASFKN